MSGAVNSTDHGFRQAILYARVSTVKQSAEGYSLRQQLEALREHCAREGYEVLAEVEDPGFSGADIQRPGIDRVRELVSEGNVYIVLAQDRDRISREPALHYFLKQEFERHGTLLRALNDRGDNTAEGELFNGIFDQLAKFERAKMMERSKRGMKRRVREGKVIRGAKARFGFRYTENGESLVVDEAEMRVVRRIFRMVGGEGRSMGEVERALNDEGIPSPGGGRWYRNSVRNVIISEMYRPLTFAEVAPLVSPEVAARLDDSPESVYGLWARGMTSSERWKERDLDGNFVNRVKNLHHPRSEWLFVPISLKDADLSRNHVDAALEVLEKNLSRRTAATVGRFWELSGGIIRCDVCSNGFSTNVTGPAHKKRSYYCCFTRRNLGREACSNGRHVRAAEIEYSVWLLVMRLLSEPEIVLKQYDAWVERRKANLRVSSNNPDTEVRSLRARLQHARERRDNTIDLAVRKLITENDLLRRLADEDGNIAELNEKLARTQSQIESIESLDAERDRMYARFDAMRGIDLRSTTPEERRTIYRALRLRVGVDGEANVRVSGIFDTDITELLPMSKVDFKKQYRRSYNEEIPDKYRGGKLIVASVDGGERFTS